MPTPPLLQAVFVPALPIAAGSQMPFSWGATLYEGAQALSVPGGRYTPQALALALHQGLSGILGTGAGVSIFYRPVLDVSGAPLSHEIVAQNRGAQILTLHAGREDFALAPEGDVRLGLGPQFGSGEIVAAPGSESRWITWPASGAFPLRLPGQAVRFDNESRVESRAESGRLYSWSGPPASRLEARLEAVPVDAARRPAGWSYGEGLWRREQAEAPFSALFGPRSGPLRGAPFLLYPDRQSRRFFSLRLDSKEIAPARRLHGFVDLSFEALEQELPEAQMRRVGPDFGDDFSGGLSQWSQTTGWQIVSGELQVDTGALPRRIVFNETFKDLEAEAELYFLAAPAEGEQVTAGIGLDFGSNRFVGVALRAMLSGGVESTSLVTESFGASGGGQELANLERARPVAAPAPRLRVQFFSNPHTAGAATEVHVRAWVGGEGPFEAVMAPGFALPFLKNPILFYLDDLAVDPGAEARFDNFACRELYWDSGPDRLTLEDLGVD